MERTRNTKDQQGVGHIEALLREATGLLDEVAEDPLFARLVRIFDRTPAADRPHILAILEREIGLRAIASENERSRPLTGFAVTRLNTNARLYVRAVEPEDEQPYLSRDELVLAMGRAVRAIHLTTASSPATGKALDSVVLESLAQATPEERDAIEWTLRRLLALVERARTP